MIKHSLGLLLIWSISMVQSQVNDPCASHCICDDTNTTCVECEMWYARNEQGKCAQYIDKVLLKNRTNIGSVHIDFDRLSVKFFQQDLDIELYAQDYYYYTLQYKMRSSTGNFTDSGFSKHYNRNQRWKEMSVQNLVVGTSYELRVALYRMFPLRGWKEFLDATITVIMTTKAIVWNQRGEYEMLHSDRNGLPKRTFDEAEQYCNNFDGHLVSVTSLAEQEYLRYAYGWIGLYIPGEGTHTTGCDTCLDCALRADTAHCAQCASCRDKWRWTDGSLVQVNFWDDFYPRGNYRCAVTHSRWKDSNCGEKEDFTCKRVFRNARTSTTSTSTMGLPVSLTSNADMSNSTTTQISQTSTMALPVLLTSNTAASPSTIATQISDTSTTSSTAKGLTSLTIMSTQNPSVSRDIQTTVIKPTLHSTTSNTLISSSTIGWQFAIGICVAALVLIFVIAGVVICCIKGIKKELKKQLQEYEEIYKIYDLTKPMPRDSGYLRPVNKQRQDGEAIAMDTVNEGMGRVNQYQSLSNPVNSEMEKDGDDIYNVIVQ